jgi:endonuclease YncB( thermonuclease family)
VLLAGVALCGGLAALAQSSPSGRFVARGTVVHVVDGDTLDIGLATGGRTRVRLIGIDTPEVGQCYAARATAAARRLAFGRHVVLRGDRTQ